MIDVTRFRHFMKYVTENNVEKRHNCTALPEWQLVKECFRHNKTPKRTDVNL